MSRAEKYLARACGNSYWFLPGDVRIVTDKDHPLYDERAHDPIDREMVDSIKLLGVLQNPLVSMQVDDDGKQYAACIVGRQRLMNAIVAAEELALEGKLIPSRRPGHIECTIRNDFTPEELREVIIHENAKRREETLKTKIGNGDPSPRSLQSRGRRSRGEVDRGHCPAPRCWALRRHRHGGQAVGRGAEVGARGSQGHLQRHRRARAGG